MRKVQKSWSKRFALRYRAYRVLTKISAPQFSRYESQYTYISRARGKKVTLGEVCNLGIPSRRCTAMPSEIPSLWA